MNYINDFIYNLGVMIWICIFASFALGGLYLFFKFFFSLRYRWLIAYGNPVKSNSYHLPSVFNERDVKRYAAKSILIRADVEDGIHVVFSNGKMFCGPACTGDEYCPNCGSKIK